MFKKLVDLPRLEHQVSFFRQQDFLIGLFQILPEEGGEI